MAVLSITPGARGQMRVMVRNPDPKHALARRLHEDMEADGLTFLDSYADGTHTEVWVFGREEVWPWEE